MKYRNKYNKEIVSVEFIYSQGKPFMCEFIEGFALVTYYSMKSFFNHYEPLTD